MSILNDKPATTQNSQYLKIQNKQKSRGRERIHSAENYYFISFKSPPTFNWLLSTFLSSLSINRKKYKKEKSEKVEEENILLLASFHFRLQIFSNRVTHLQTNTVPQASSTSFSISPHTTSGQKNCIPPPEHDFWPPTVVHLHNYLDPPFNINSSSKPYTTRRKPP